MGRVGLPFSQLGLSDIYQCGYEGRNKNQLITWNDKTLAGNQLCLLKVRPRERHSAALKGKAISGVLWSNKLLVKPRLNNADTNTTPVSGFTERMTSVRKRLPAAGGVMAGC